MKIFQTQENSGINQTENKVSNSPVKKRGRAKQKLPAEKPSVSEQEIREKVAAHVETSNTAKSVALKKNSQKLGEGFLNPDSIPEHSVKNQEQNEVNETPKSEDKHLLKTDINLNDPKDPTTQEKLKTVLSTGAFNFNAKEREALDRILNGT